MKPIQDLIYSPVVKTRDAELKGLEQLSSSVKDKILPVYELTKSRKSSRAPDGDIFKRMKKIAEIQQDRPFVLDLCTDEKYINPQIEQLLDESRGYSYWLGFLNIHKNLNIIPMVHLYDDEDFEEVESFVRSAVVDFQVLAVRLPFDLDDIEHYVAPIARCYLRQ
ncbi:beta family protein [Endozoicomonas montiporae]|uniref:Uncharacterized protein n=1 Tax=Endozoicomonas montiporae CL-33 TaxID=570277 RepID=A0A142BJ66_9GAMM|nr:hypothetical protein [Endozoicomonas montiporae]AMO58792.1 hypothetical protein EZMO1_4904 [Endozoicomonas montiporae CL-33]